MIRESPNSPGLAISIRYGNDVKHIKIGRSGNRYYLTEAKQFESVEEVINYYKVNTLGVSFPTLPTNLTIGVSSKIPFNISLRRPWLLHIPYLTDFIDDLNLLILFNRLFLNFFHSFTPFIFQQINNER